MEEDMFDTAFGGYDPGSWGSDILDPSIFEDPGMSVPSGEETGAWSWDSIMGGSGGGTEQGGLWGLLNGPLGKGLMSGISGLYGLSQADKLKGMAKTAFDRADPFGGFRPEYGKQLMGLMSDPNSITKDPGYKFAFDQGLTGVERKMAKEGYLGSGNEAIELQKYGMGFASDYLQQKEQFLAQLAGAGMGPNYGPSMGGYAQGASLAGDSMASIAYGMTRAGGASAGTPGSGGFNSAGGEAAKTLGYGRKGIDLAKQFGYNVPDWANKGVSMASNVMGVISGLDQGGVHGYLSAGANAVKLGSSAGLLSKGAGTLAGKVAAPLAVYDFISNWESGDTGSDAMRGAQAGAAIGSIVPGIGTLIGALGGAAIGAISSIFGPGEESHSHKTWESWKQYEGQGHALNLDPYGMAEVFKGAWESNQKGFGGGKFQDRNDYLGQFTSQLEEGLKSGKITTAMTAMQINDAVISPWMKGYGAPDPAWVKGVNTDLIQQYMAGKPLYGDTSLKSDAFRLGQTRPMTPPARGNSPGRFGGGDPSNILSMQAFRDRRLPAPPQTSGGFKYAPISPSLAHGA